MVKNLAMGISIWKVNILYDSTNEFWSNLNKNLFIEVFVQVNSNKYVLLMERVKEMLGLMENELPKRS
jgi:hypothetical protein